MTDIIIVGCGGLGIETAELVNQINMQRPYKKYNILGFVDDNEQYHGRVINGYKVLGGLSVIKENKGVSVAIAIANGKIRKSIVQQIQDYCIFPKLIHPTVMIPETTALGRGAIIFAYSVISVNVIIGEYAIISPKCGIGHGSIVCSFSSLMWNVNVAGDSMVMSFSYLGTNSTVLQGLVIEPNSTIGAGAVVIKSVKANSTMVGVPAKKIK